MKKILVLVLSAFALNALADVQPKVGFIHEGRSVVNSPVYIITLLDQMLALVDDPELVEEMARAFTKAMNNPEAQAGELEDLGSQFRNKFEALQKQMENKGALLGEIKDLEKQVQSSTLNAESREERNKELIAKRVRYKKLSALEANSGGEILEKIEEFQSKIPAIVKSYAKSNGFSVIYKLDLDETRPMKDRSLLYLDPALDITEDVAGLLFEKTVSDQTNSR